MLVEKICYAKWIVMPCLHEESLQKTSSLLQSKPVVEDVMDVHEVAR